MEGLIGETNLGERQPAVDLHLAKVLITELLWGKQTLKPENARAIKIILELEADLRHRLDESTQAEEPAPIRGK